MAFTDLLLTFGFALGITGPIFIVVFLGLFLKRIGLIDDKFNNDASALVFKAGLPALLFLSIYRADLKQSLDGSMVLYGLVSTLALFMLLSITARFFTHRTQDNGVFIQGAFRGNLGIIGLAFCASTYGDIGLAAASLLMAPLTILYNVLSVYTLNNSLNNEGKNNWAAIATGVVKNPLIIGLSLGLAFNFLGIRLPKLIIDTGSYFSQLTLPLALLCVGASLSFKDLIGSNTPAYMAVFIKLVAFPAITVLGAYALGFHGMELGILFLLSSTPTACASYVMVQALKGNATLAANIILLSTLASVLTVSAGLAMLKSGGWV